MKTTALVTVIGEISGTPVRKTVNDKDVTEFYITDCGLRISAWEQRARDVPESGVMVVSGYINTRTYKYEGKDRTSTEIRATQVQIIDTAPEEPAF